VKLFYPAVVVVLLSFACPTAACIVYGGGVVYLNKPNITVNLSVVTENANASANYTLIQNGVAFRSHYNESLAVQITEDKWGWSVGVGVAGEPSPQQQNINYSEAIEAELNWLWAHKVINGTTPEDIKAISGLLSNNPHHYVMWKNGSWTAMQNNCFPDGSCVRCGPAGASLNTTMPPYGLELPERSDDEKIEACLAGLSLLLLIPTCFVLNF